MDSYNESIRYGQYETSAGQWDLICHDLER